MQAATLAIADCRLETIDGMVSRTYYVRCRQGGGVAISVKLPKLPKSLKSLMCQTRSKNELTNHEARVARYACLGSLSNQMAKTVQMAKKPIRGHKVGSTDGHIAFKHTGLNTYACNSNQTVTPMPTSSTTACHLFKSLKNLPTGAR